jgi:hypothetical protein
MVVRGGVEPPTPRFSGADNARKLEKSIDSGASGVPWVPCCCHDLSRLVMRRGLPSGPTSTLQVLGVETLVIAGDSISGCVPRPGRTRSSTLIVREAVADR